MTEIKIYQDGRKPLEYRIDKHGNNTTEMIISSGNIFSREKEGRAEYCSADYCVSFLRRSDYWDNIFKNDGNLIIIANMLHNVYKKGKSVPESILGYYPSTRTLFFTQSRTDSQGRSDFDRITIEGNDEINGFIVGTGMVTLTPGKWRKLRNFILRISEPDPDDNNYRKLSYVLNPPIVRVVNKGLLDQLLNNQEKDLENWVLQFIREKKGPLADVLIVDFSSRRPPTEVSALLPTQDDIERITNSEVDIFKARTLARKFAVEETPLEEEEIARIITAILRDMKPFHSISY